MIYATVLIGLIFIWMMFFRKRKPEIKPTFFCKKAFVETLQEVQMFNALNHERRIEKIPPLIYCEQLNETAKLVAEFLDEGGEFSHSYFREIVRPSMKQKYPKLQMGEIIARHTYNVYNVIDAWMLSDSHRRVILFPKWVCFGYKRVGNYWVVHFAYENLKI